jgi:hypothetical protein
MRSSISINRIVIFVVVAGYMFVNIRMQMVFFAGPATPEHNIWSKYQIATTWEDALRIGQDAYYAKTGWLVILLALQAFNVPFGLAFGLSFVCYAIAMLIFFGLNPTTTAYMVGAVALLASYFVKWPRTSSAYDKV